MAMQSQDPIKGFLFQLDVQGKVVGLFTECSGIGSETEVIEHKVMQNGKPVIMKVPGRLKWENVTLKRGITDNMDVWKWRHEIEVGNVEANRFTGSIIMTDHDLKPVAEWTFERAWPTKVSGPTPKADSNEIGIEEIIIAHEGIRRVV
ncbi:MAG TPA: phage tail protein [Caldilineaceae bacterium]|nr:phage tail protein [Caldilineaceae bacterium]HRW06062.1 phage tail protein [Caldilineaceae bacterium]